MSDVSDTAPEMKVNPFKQYMDDIVQSVPALLCIIIADVHGTVRLHGCKNTNWKQWRLLPSFYYEPDQLEQTLYVSDGLPRKLNRVTMFLDDYIIVQDAHRPKVELPEGAGDEWGTSTPTVVICLVGTAVDGEGDSGALIALLDRLKECPMFQTIASAVVIESEYE